MEACRFHGVNPEELVEIPFREFQRAYSDDPEMALRRFERVDKARKLMLESVYQKWEEICWEETHRDELQTRAAKKKTGEPRESVIEINNNKRLTVLEMQAKKFRKVEKQQWKGLRNKLFVEMKKAIHDQKSKTIIEKHENIGDAVSRKRREMEIEKELKLQAEFEEAEEKEREAQKLIRIEQRKALQEAKAKVARHEQRVRKEKREQVRIVHILFFIYMLNLNNNFVTLATSRARTFSS